MSRAALVDPAGTPMVGRSRELAELRERFAASGDGDPQVVVIGGEAGIGKSRLVAELLGGLPDRTRVAVGHCLELGPDGPPFAPFSAVLRDLAADLGPARLAELAGPGRADLAVLDPELGPVSGADPMGRGRLFEAMATLLERCAADAPLVLVVEDLHWSDSSTRDLLRFLTRTVGDAPVLFVLTYRRDEMHRGHPLLPWLVEVDRLPTAHRIVLERLDDAEVDALVRLVADGVPDRAAARIRERSQGIPFFVEELASCADRDARAIPETLRDLMLTRLERLTPRTRDVLRVASAASTRVDHPVLLAVLDRDEAALDEALREAVSGQVLVVDPSREAYSFRHALMREAVHDDLLPGEHARLHARYAQALERSGRPEQAGEIAHHWMSAHEADRAFDWSLRAADHARASYAWREQMAHLERALDLWDQVSAPADRAGFDRAELLVRTSRAAANLGLPDRAIALLDSALAEVDPSAPQRLAHLLLSRAVQCEGAQRDPIGDLDRVLALAGDGSRDRARALVVRASLMMLEADLVAARAVAQQALAAAEQCEDADLLSGAHNTLGCVLIQSGRFDEGSHHLDRARELAVAAGRPAELFRYYSNYSDVLIGAGRFAEAMALAGEGRRRAAEEGLARTHGAFLAGNEVEAAVLAGEWDTALATADEALRMDPPQVTRGHLHVLRGLLLARRGDLASAADGIDRAGELLTRAARQPQHVLPLGLARAELAWAEGAADEALAVLEGTAAPFGGTVAPAAGWPFTWAWGRMLLEAGAPDHPGRAQMAAHLVGAAPHPGWVTLVGAQARALAGAEEVDWAGAVRATAATEGLRHELADARLRWVEQLLAAGERDEARAQLTLAWQVIEDLADEALVPAASRVAARGRFPVPRPEAPSTPDGPDLLTPREREVLALVAAGRSNGQIAAELFISVKTASVHVSHILAKLGVPTRTAAAAWAHAHLPAG